MQIQEDKQGDIFIFTISEHLDTVSSTMFETRLLGSIDRGERLILVEIARLSST